jgi:hypothetical protein
MAVHRVLQLADTLYQATQPCCEMSLSSGSSYTYAFLLIIRRSIKRSVDVSRDLQYLTSKFAEQAHMPSCNYLPHQREVNLP